jgi:phenylpyruvate tautomerase PptA (4-oxalocrotonate tautomerase family)
MTNTIEQAGNDLLAAMDALAEQQSRVEAAKARIMELMTDAGVKTAKLPTAQVQVVATDVWEYRDRGVTEARKSVEAKERELKGVKAVLKGAEGAAKAAGGARARVVETKVSVRVVRSGGGMM